MRGGTVVGMRKCVRYILSQSHEGRELTSLKTADGSKAARRSKISCMQVHPGLLRQGRGGSGKWAGLGIVVPHHRIPSGIP